LGGTAGFLQVLSQRIFGIGLFIFAKRRKNHVSVKKTMAGLYITKPEENKPKIVKNKELSK
jgi:hypothetical protein